MSTTFTSLGLPEKVTSLLETIAYTEPTPVQAACIPALLAGEDLLGQAQTGTGKTAAFALPLLTHLDENDNRTQLLVLTPTRELAIQVSLAFEKYGKNFPRIRTASIYGGARMSNQLRALKQGAHIVVGTPGRVMDHIRRKSLNLSGLSALVLDEADEMLKMGFIEDIEWILERSPQDKQLALFSATMPPAIQKVARKHLKEAREVKIKSKTTTADSIEQFYWVTKGVHKLDALSRILEVKKTEAVIVFARTKQGTVEVADALTSRGHAAVALNGDLNQQAREQVIARLRSGKVSIVVATDVAARGIDVERISHVINYDMPQDPEVYTHRIGRTGRAGRSGQAIIFASPRERGMLRSIEKATRQPLKEFLLPDKETVTKKRIAEFKEQALLNAKTRDLEFFHGIAQELLADDSVPDEKIIASLCYLAQKQTPLIVRDSKKPPRDEEPARRRKQTRSKGRRSFKKPGNFKRSRPKRTQGSDQRRRRR